MKKTQKKITLYSLATDSPEFQLQRDRIAELISTPDTIVVNVDMICEMLNQYFPDQQDLIMAAAVLNILQNAATLQRSVILLAPHEAPIRYLIFENRARQLGFAITRI